MSGYIYAPPPPPPDSTPTPNRGSSANGQRGGPHNGFHSGRGGRGGGGRGGGSGGGRGDERNRGGRRYENPSGQRAAQQGISRARGPLPPSQRRPHPLPPLLGPQPPLPPNLYLLPNQPYRPVTPPTTNIYNLPGYSAQTPPSPILPFQPPPPPVPTGLAGMYLSYAREKYDLQNAPVPPILGPPIIEKYVSSFDNWPSQPSYGHFQPPEPNTPPPPKEQRRDDKPDMDNESWLNLNGGKLLGTNIEPPMTPEEIEEWIKQRKARYPTARKIAENEEKQKIEKEAREKTRAQAQNAASHGQSPVDPSNFGKRKRSTTGEGRVPINSAGDSSDPANNGDHDDNDDDDDDAPPEAVSSKTKSSLPDAPTIKRNHEPRPKKKMPICKVFAARGKCNRGDGCKFRHEIREEKPKRKEKKAEDDGRKSLYQRLMENDREKENVLMLQFIKYLVDKGKLQEEEEPKGKGEEISIA